MNPLFVVSVLFLSYLLGKGIGAVTCYSLVVAMYLWGRWVDTPPSHRFFGSM
jgi:hypothetical protein